MGHGAAGARRDAAVPAAAPAAGARCDAAAHGRPGVRRHGHGVLRQGDDAAMNVLPILHCCVARRCGVPLACLAWLQASASAAASAAAHEHLFLPWPVPIVARHPHQGTLVDAINRGDFVSASRDGGGFKPNWKARLAVCARVRLPAASVASVCLRRSQLLFATSHLAGHLQHAVGSGAWAALPGLRGRGGWTVGYVWML